jgi:hypothetical protein
VISITASSATPVTGPTPAKPASVRNASPFQSTSPFQSGSSFGASWGPGNGGGTSADAKRRFAEAVDLYFSQQYAQALNIFESLAEDYPDNADINSGKSMCMAALKNRQQLALEHQHGQHGNFPVPMDGRGGAEPARRLSPPTESIPENVVEDTLKHVLVEKMLNGSDDRIQLRAAELAIRVFGFGKKKPGDDDKERADDIHEDVDGETPDLDEHQAETGSTPSEDEDS